MAADILIHNADMVPVGKDQEAHLELTRTYASRFNRLYNVEYFKEPKAYNFDEELVKIPGLDGSLKMGKSEGNAIYLKDSPQEIRKKIMKAKTDEGPTQENQPKSQEIINLFTLMKHVSSPETFLHFEQAYNNCSIRYGDLKKQLAEDVISFGAPIRDRINELSANEDYLEKVMHNGAEKARASGGKTLSEVREIIGFRASCKLL
jgi:tryptophanyl-tRNA synthetase